MSVKEATMQTIRLHSLVDRSRANGPGQRAVLWTAGCSLKCPSCFNPETHDPRAGELVLIDDLATRLLAIEGIQGVTISGGEPLQQPQAVQALLEQLRARSTLSVVLFSGFAWAEIARMPIGRHLPALVDVLIAGRYQADQRVASGLIGSANKDLRCFSSRYTSADFAPVPPAEVRIAADGTMTLTGINPLVLRGSHD